MFDWVQLAILLLKLVNGIINWAHDRGMIDEGRRQVLAENALNIATKVQTRDQIREKIDAMSEAEVDAQLGGLVDPPAGGTKSVHS
jgi:hypothetical protein